MAQSAPSLNPLGLDPDGLVHFGLALLLGSVIVVLHCWPKFDESTLPKNDEDLITQFLPRDLVSSKEYSQGLFTYIVSMLLLLGVLSVLGPSILKLFAIRVPTELGATPVVVALAFGGFLQNVPMLKNMEIMIRRFAHRRAFIPAAARATADRLTAAKFNFSQYQGADVLRSEEMSGVKSADFEARRGSIEYNWARLCSLCYALRAREEEETRTLDRRLLNSYRSDLESVYVNRASLQAKIDRFRKNSDASRKELRVKIRDTLQKLYVFIGCSTRLSGRNRSVIDRALQDFGFDLEPVHSEPQQGDVMIVGLAVMAGSVLLICWAAYGLGVLHLWDPSPYFPTKAFDPFVWAISAALAHGGTILTADRFRGAMLRNEKWYDSAGVARKPSIANYIRVGLVCMLVGYIVLLACGFVLQPPTWAMAAGAAPYAFMPAVTGAFYASHLDNVELDRRSGWLLEIGPQAILTSFMGITASNVWISLGDTTWPTGIDFVILVAIMGFAVGASLAWYIPKNAVRRNYDPLREVKENRVREITALAVERFSNPDKAEHWLQTETSSLQGASPMTALSEARNYEEVLRLINRIPAAQLNGTGPQGKTLAKAKRRPSRRAQPTKGFSEPVLGLAEGKTRGLNPSGRSPRRNRQPADIRFDLQSGLPGRQHQLGARPVAQHDELGTGADRGARSGRPIDAGDVSETADIPPRAAEVRLGGAEHEAGAQAPDRERIAPSVEEQRIAAADGHRQ